MNISTNIDLNIRSIKEFARVMLPDIEDDIFINLSEDKKNIKVEASNGKDKVVFSFENLENIIEEQKLSMSKIVLLKLYNKKYSWGSLMGVRPTKVLRRLLEKKLSYSEAKKILKDFYLLSDKKIKLMEEVLQKEEKLLNDNFINVYIGIPFCPTKCNYCSFASYEIDGGVGRFYNDFVKALKEEIVLIGKYLKTYPKKISSVYFGGGTPAILKEKDLDEILKTFTENFDLANVIEFCFEAGREDALNENKLDILKKYGIDRISLNPQTFNEETLKKLNRNFNKKHFDELFSYAKKLDFSINMDIILGLPNETTADILKTIKELYKYDIDNLTVHTLAYKRRSKLFSKNVNFTELDRELIENELEKLCNFKKLKPYYLYRQKNIVEWGENLGYSIDGKESIFNVEMIEENQNTMALGGGGISKIVFKEKNKNDYIKRCVNPKDPCLYIKELQKRIEEKINLFEKYK